MISGIYTPLLNSPVVKSRQLVCFHFGFGCTCVNNYKEICSSAKVKTFWLKMVGSVFTAYNVVSKYPHLKHPNPIVETTSLSCIRPPNIVMNHSIPVSCLKEDCSTLSGAQMDAILLCAQSHEKFEGIYRQGFCIGKEGPVLPIVCTGF